MLSIAYISAGALLFRTHTAASLIKDSAWKAALVEVPAEHTVIGVRTHTLPLSPAIAVSLQMSLGALAAVQLPVEDSSK